MITLSKVKSILLEKGRRIVKVIQFGPKTSLQASPFGDDSSPLPGYTAIFCNTSERGEPIVIGYISKGQLAEPGEKRIFSLKSDGSDSFDIYLRGDGTCEIGGDVDNMVRYIPLDAALKVQDTLINAELAKIATAIGTLGGTYVPALVETDISASRIEEIKTS